jgi:hypothetical protein
MAHYTGPVCRLCRRLGDKLYLKGEKCFSPKCSFERRPYPPGPRSMRRRKVSDRGLQLREKQRARATYGVMERQFRRYYAEALGIRRLAGPGPSDSPARARHRQRSQGVRSLSRPEGGRRCRLDIAGAGVQVLRDDERTDDWQGRAVLAERGCRRHDRPCARAAGDRRDCGQVQSGHRC